MKNKRFMAGITAAVVALPLLAFSVSPAMANTEESESQNNGKKVGQQIPAELQQMRDELQKIFDNNDYAAWKALVENKRTVDGKVCQVDPLLAVNASNFARFAEMHKLMKDKQFAKADEIRKELGLCAPGGMQWNKLAKKLNKIDKNNPGLGKYMRLKHYFKNK